MRCPVCRADNTTGPLCRRCRADLSLLYTLEGQRRVMLARAADALRRGDAAQIVRLAGAAQDLRRGPDSSRLAALGHLLQGDFAAAWRSYRASTFAPPT